MNSLVDTLYLEDGNLQRYQIITGFEWEDVLFTSSCFKKTIVNDFARLYRINIIPKNPSFYGTLVFYNLPESFELKLNKNTDIGTIYNSQVLLNYYFQNSRVEVKSNELIFDDSYLQEVYEYLVKENLVSIAQGTNNKEILFLPIDSHISYLSDNDTSNTILVNSHFFLMEKTDRDSPYDELGTPHSLALKDGVIIQPPLNHRECLLVTYEDKVEIKDFEIKDLKVKVGNVIYINNVNSKFYYRPETRITPKTKGMSIVIVGDKVVATKFNGEVIVPMAGFVIQTEDKIILEDINVSYLGDSENYRFGIQVGPAMTNNFVKTESLTCPFYKGEGTPYPSTVYPLDFDKGRASRIGLGELDGSPVLIWAEGASKLGHIKGEESCGASLLEFANYCESKNIKYLLNLDGGGSAQIIVNEKRTLKIADRKDDNTEAERPVPMGLSIKIQ